MNNIYQTPEERFTAIPDFPWRPKRLNLPWGDGSLSMAYLDEGPKDAEHVYLCLHGQPTWSFLYRSMIPVFLEAGGRVLAPDLIGFGRSDKPVDDDVYTFDFHRGNLLRFIEELDLRRVTLVLHDWGGLLGLTLPMEDPSRYDRLIIMNTAFSTGDIPLGKGFLDWRAWVAANPDLDVGRLMKRAAEHLNEAETAAYSAPFPEQIAKAGVRRFPALVADAPDAPGAEISRRARTWWSEQWDGPSFMAVGMKDPVLGPPAMALVRRAIRGCPKPMEVPDAGHFVPEHGEEIARRALAAFNG